MKRVLLPGWGEMPTVGYAEKPRRSDPAAAPTSAGSLSLSAADRGAILREALERGASSALLTHERDVLTFVEARRAAGLPPDAFTIVTTDGGCLARCPPNAQSAEKALETAIARKRHMLAGAPICALLLMDLSRETHVKETLAGVSNAVAAAMQTGEIGVAGLLADSDPEFAAEIVECQPFPISLVAGVFNALDQRAAERLAPACAANGALFFAVNVFAWTAGVPFVRFPNTWRLRNMSQSFFGISAAEAHLRWALQQPGIRGAFVAMDERGQAAQNTAPVAGDTLLPPPTGVEALLREFVDAIARTDEGWRGLLGDERWDYRYAAREVLTAAGIDTAPAQLQDGRERS